MIETRRLLPAALGGLLVLAAARSGSAGTIAIEAGWLVDPESGKASRGQVVLVEEGKVKAVGPGLPIPKGAEVVDLSGAAVLPGLFDCHTHLCIRTGRPASEAARDIWAALLLTTASNSTGYRAIQGVAHAREMLEAGFTTVRDVGNAALYADTDLRRAIEEGLVPGPTLLNAGRIIAPTGGQFPSKLPSWIEALFGENPAYIGVLPPDRPGLGSPEYLYADTPEELRKAVRENVLYGARVIKIVVDDQPYTYSADDIRVVVEEAARAGLKVAAHCITDRGAKAAVEGGVASVEHGFLLSDEILELMRKNGTVLVGTDFPESAAKEIGIPVELFRRAYERLKHAHRIGVTMAFGSDLFFTPPGTTRGTMAASYVDVYRAAGIPAAVVLRMMTANAARLLGVEGERGHVRPGLAADLIATSGNPLEDIQALKRVVFVMKDGKIVRRP